MTYRFKSINQLKSVDELKISSCLFLHGKAIDNRGKAILNHAQNSRLTLMNIEYNHLAYKFSINNEIPFTVIELTNYLREITDSRVVIDSTTLSFPEILIILNILYKNSNICFIDLIYAEPERYCPKDSEINFGHEFELSEYDRYKPIPGFVRLVESESLELVTFLGFEQTRLGQLIQNDDKTTYTKLSPIIPLPAFTLGWEHNTLQSNLNYFTQEYGFTKLRYVGANNPFHAYTILQNIANETPKFRIAPIGPKPSSIGCAIFLINKKISQSNGENSIDVIYDYPTMFKGRSEGIGGINVYSLIKS